MQEFDDVYSGLVCDVAESLVATRTTLSLGLARLLDQCSASPRLSLLRHEIIELESLQTFARQVYLELELMNVPGPVGGPFSASFLTETLPYLYEFCAIESGIMGGSRDRRGRRVCRYQSYTDVCFAPPTQVLVQEIPYQTRCEERDAG